MCEFLSPHFFGRVPASYVPTLDMLVVKLVIDKLERHTKEVEEAIVNNRVDPDQVKNVSASSFFNDLLFLYIFFISRKDDENFSLRRPRRAFLPFLLRSQSFSE